MFVQHLLPALVAIGSVAAQTQTCTVSTTTIHSQADATQLAGCGTISGSIVIAGDAADNIDLSGPKKITGDVTVENNGKLTSLASTSLTSIGGTFKLNNVTTLTSITLSNLTSVQSLLWTSVTKLNALQLGPLTQADNVVIGDTFLDTLNDIALTSVHALDINNNRRLTKFTSSLETAGKAAGDTVSITANGLDLVVDLSKLVWATNLEIANVTTISIPSLKVVNGSARFDSNNFDSFAAPNLTQTVKGDLSFVGNSNLNNVSFPQLTAVNGGLLIANNTALHKIDFFSKLQNVAGAIKLRGNFTDVEFPALKVVNGAFDASSTGDIQKSCDKVKSQNAVSGAFHCESNNAQANQDTNGTTTGGSGGGGGGGGSDGKGENSAAGTAFNAALFGLVAVAALASAL